MKISCIYNNSQKSQDMLSRVQKFAPHCSPENSDIIVVIGGDGELLHAIHKYMHLQKPFYALNAGTIGFLANNFSEDLLNQIQNSEPSILHPLQMNAQDVSGITYEALAINEAYIFRTSHQAAKFSISINNVLRMKELVADGAMVSTPAGSSAYNLSSGGHIVPLNSNILSLTPICPFRPRRWRGALIDESSVVSFNVMTPVERPVNAVADFQEFKNIKYMEVKQRSDISITLLFEHNHKLEDRLIKEQFWGE
jgi:NAD+ kinase